MKNKKLLILGIGNLLMGDEGLGVHAIRALEARGFPPPEFENAIELLDGGSGGFTLVGEMEKYQHILLIDATADDDEEGAIKKLTPRFAHEYPPTLTAHDVGLKDMLDVFYLSGTSTRIVLFSVTVRFACCRLGVNLSPAIENVLPKLCQMVKDEAMRIIQLP